MAILVHAHQVVLETEAVALRLLECDSHNGLGRGGIAGAWVLDDIDVLDLVAAQAGQFAHILHLAAIDIDLGITTTKHRNGAIALGFQRRHAGKRVDHGTGLLKNSPFDGRAHGFALDTCLGQLALHYHLTEQQGVLFHLNGQPLSDIQVLRLITDARHLDQGTVITSYYLESWL